jgi:hypothetical protein
MSGFNRAATFVAAFARGLGCRILIAHSNAMNCFCLDEGTHAIRPSMLARWASKAPILGRFLQSL